MRSTFIPAVTFLAAVTLVASSPLFDVPTSAPVNVNTQDVKSIVATQPKERCNDGCGSNDLLDGLLGPIDVVTDVDTVVKLDNVLDLDTIVYLVLNTSANTPSCYTPGCNENDILVWMTDLNIKTSVILTLINGKKDSHKHLMDLVTTIDTALLLLTKVDIDTSKRHGNKCNDLVKLVASLLSNTTVSLSTCGTLDLDVVSKLDVALSSLLVALDLHAYGLAGLCGDS